ncbi:TonB-dependent receptor [Steroidobacter sp.]|uniref:TonB-dependent receptor n=1 Tax=Steroidobacter sp. TaxID=1978227 RepID=UPI001A3FE23B|nr:TonB-dependent receptor [Steroidobacter sp.]MBL8268923.1 TonB-dependent receptor [Steroidobacter sp.]
MFKESKLLLAVSLAAAVQPAVTLAQSEAVLEEVTVTAQKREQRLIEVPVSITAISGTDLEQRGISSAQDLSFAVPGLTMHEDGPGQNVIFMRGMSNLYGSDALVGVYLDEAPLTIGIEQLDSRVLDLERVEVLKGPQGTLYGQGSVAGVIRFITKKPELDAFSGRVEASQSFIDGGDSKEAFTGVVNLPLITDKFAVRLAATLEQGGGWQDQPEAGIKNGNNQDLVNVRGKALWQLSDAFTAEAMVVIHRNESKLGQGYENADRTVFVAIDPARVLVPKEYDYDLYNLTLTYDLGGAQLMSSSSYVDHSQVSPYAYKGGPETNFNNLLEGNDERFWKARSFTEEVRLASTGDGPFSWTFGAYYRTLDKKFESYSDTLYNGTVDPTYYYLDIDEWKSYAVFADVSYDLTERLQLGLGARYFEDEQMTFDGSLREEDSFNSFDPRVYASYKVADDMNVYVSAGKGFRTGGFNRGIQPNYQPEEVWSYELGLKGLIADGRAQIELAAYYTDYSDMLRRGLVFVPGGTPPLQQLTSNVGKAEVKGLEGGITWRATDALTLNTTAAYIDSEITEVNATSATNLPGDPMDYTPKFSFTAGANYGFDVGSLPGYARVDYSYRDEVTLVVRSNYPAANLPQRTEPISLVDARVGLEIGAAWVELFGSNLTNQNKWIDPNFGFLNANRTRPRAIGFKVGYKF